MKMNKRTSLYYLGEKGCLFSDLESALVHQDRFQLQPLDSLNGFQLGFGKNRISSVALVDTCTVNKIPLEHLINYMSSGGYIFFIDSRSFDPRPSRSIAADIEIIEKVKILPYFGARMESVRFRINNYLPNGSWTDFVKQDVNFPIRNHEGKIITEEDKKIIYKNFKRWLDTRPSFQDIQKGIERISKEEENKLHRDVQLNYAISELAARPLHVLPEFEAGYDPRLARIAYLDRILEVLGVNNEGSSTWGTVNMPNSKFRYSVKTVCFTSEQKLCSDSEGMLDMELPGWYELYMESFEKFELHSGVKRNNREIRAKRNILHDFAIGIYDTSDEKKLIGTIFFSVRPKFENAFSGIEKVQNSIYGENAVTYLASLCVTPGREDKQHVINLLQETFYTTLFSNNGYFHDNTIYTGIHPKAYPPKLFAFDYDYIKHPFPKKEDRDEIWKLLKEGVDGRLRPAEFMEAIKMARHNLRDSAVLDYLESQDTKLGQDPQNYLRYFLRPDKPGRKFGFAFVRNIAPYLGTDLPAPTSIFC